jgi:AraC-like DNA-binding protein
MVAGTALLPIQFLLQYTLHFREMGVEPAVLVNLLFFIPAAWLISLAILNLLRQSSLRLHDWLVGPGSYLVAVVVLLGANPTGGHDILDVTPRLYYAEVAAAVVYALMQFHYTGQLWREFRRVGLALDNYFDRERHGIISWMGNSTMLLSLSAVFAPMVIFWSGPLLIVYTLTIFFCISYTVVSFYGYGLDRQHLNALQQVERTMREDEQQQQRERGGGDESQGLQDQDMKRIAAAVDGWIARGGHLHGGITIQTAAEDMHVPRYLLSSWLKCTCQGLFNPWLTHLRIEEAKRQLRLHPEWNNDTIAEHCGFTSRTYFQTTFKRITGVTPQEFQGRKN